MPIPMKSTGTRDIAVGFTALVAIVVVLAGLGLFGAVRAGGPGWLFGAILAAGFAGIGMAGFAFVRAWRHLVALERLRGAVITLAGHEDATPSSQLETPEAPDVARLSVAIGDLWERLAGRQQAPEKRLERVLSSVAAPVLVVTDQGQVSLVNAAAHCLLGREQVRVGTSVFAALHRTPVIEAMERSAAAAGPVSASLTTTDGRSYDSRVFELGDQAGAVISMVGNQDTGEAGLDHDLSLHDRPPAPGSIGDEARLTNLSSLVLDTETTGLDTKADRIVSIGAVRMHGARIYRHSTIDRLINPGKKIPSRSVAVHGITDALVADAKPFAAVFENMMAEVSACVLVGHNIAFDIAMLRRDCELAGIAWRPPPALDTLLLASALDPHAADLTLEALAARLGVDIHGRHTALGDALVTAEIFACLLPQLADRRIGTLGEARAFQDSARQLRRQQQRAGWHDAAT